MKQKKFFYGMFIMLIGFSMMNIGCGEQTKQGLYVGKSFKGEMDINEALAWISQNVQSGKNYTIILGGNQVLSSSITLYYTLDYGGRQATITLKASEGGGVRKIEGAFTVSEGVTLILEGGVVLNGNGPAPVHLNGGNFVMNGGEINETVSWNPSTGVEIKRGTFTMNGGTISGHYGDGVYVGEYGRSDGGRTFIMNGGIISGNDCGVRVNEGSVFSKTGGIIYGSNAPEEKKQRAGAVYYCTDTGSEIKRRKTTAGENTNMDSSKDGTDGGWEKNEW